MLRRPSSFIVITFHVYQISKPLDDYRLNTVINRLEAGTLDHLDDLLFGHFHIFLLTPLIATAAESRELLLLL
jgi:hypothetical protein